MGRNGDTLVTSATLAAVEYGGQRWGRIRVTHMVSKGGEAAACWPGEVRGRDLL